MYINRFYEETLKSQHETTNSSFSCLVMAAVERSLLSSCPSALSCFFSLGHELFKTVRKSFEQSDYLVWKHLSSLPMYSYKSCPLFLQSRIFGEIVLSPELRSMWYIAITKVSHSVQVQTMLYHPYMGMSFCESSFLKSKRKKNMIVD